MKPCYKCILRGLLILGISLLPGRTVYCQAKSVVTPEMFGAIGDGITDDTEALLQAIQAPGDLILRKEYLVNNSKINDVSQFQVPSGKRIFGGGTVISSSTKALFLIHSSNRVTINDITLDFSLVTIGASSSPSNHGIVIINSSDVRIENVRIVSPKGDGIYIGSYNSELNHNHNIQINKCRISDFGRQGIAVIEGEGILIKNCLLTNNAKSLYGGIDIEPNHSYEAIDITIKRNTLENCGINTYRADSQLKRNNKIIVVKNNVKKQMHLTGGVGSHFAGISIQDAIKAEVKGNVVQGFVGISVYNCSVCSLNNNKIHSSYRGIRAAAVDNLSLTGNVIQMEEPFDFSEDIRLNASLVQETGTTIEISSSDGVISKNDLMGRVWIRDSSKMKLLNNKCRGERGSIYLNMNRKGMVEGRATVKGNLCEATGQVIPIVVLEGANDIVFDISRNRYLKESRGITHPKPGTKRTVQRNNVID